MKSHTHLLHTKLNFLTLLLPIMLSGKLYIPCTVPCDAMHEKYQQDHPFLNSYRVNNHTPLKMHGETL
jgi:hypothetical protein